MNRFTRNTLLAALAAAGALSVQAASLSQSPGVSVEPVAPPTILLAKNGADDPPGHVRGGHGRDNRAGDDRRAKRDGADDPVGDNRRGRGGDNPAGDDRRAKRDGADDRPGDNRQGRGGDDVRNNRIAR